MDSPLGDQASPAAPGQAGASAQDTSLPREVTSSAAEVPLPNDDVYDSTSIESAAEPHSQAHQENTDNVDEETTESDRSVEHSLDERIGGLAISGGPDSNDGETTSFPSFPERTVSLRTHLLERGFVSDSTPADGTETPGRERVDGQNTVTAEAAATESPVAAAAYPRRSSSSLHSSLRHGPSRHGSLYRTGTGSFSSRERQPRETVEYVPPRWQPDAEVTLCPICNTQFSIFVRKHHCRKCGRVVCNSCSPHRIIIPHQYIVRQPGYEMSYAPSIFMDSMGGGYPGAGKMPGGERVRLCNPCVPDPNTEPPLSPTPRSPHQRSRSSLSSGYGGAPDNGRFPAFVNALPGLDPRQSYQSSRSRSITMGPGGQAIESNSTSTRSASYQTPLERYMRPPQRRSLYGEIPSSSRQHPLPPTPQIAEEDECPVCHRELPQRSLINFETLREAHIANCIQSHSTYGSPRGVPVPEGRRPVRPRRSGMYTYPATEKDCVDDAECTICLEEFTVGVAMARLECLCRFHRSCIAAWFVNHPGRCPVHQHDGFGF